MSRMCVNYRTTQTFELFDFFSTMENPALKATFKGASCPLNDHKAPVPTISQQRPRSTPLTLATCSQDHKHSLSAIIPHSNTHLLAVIPNPFGFALQRRLSGTWLGRRDAFAFQLNKQNVLDPNFIRCFSVEHSVLYCTAISYTTQQTKTEKMGVLCANSVLASWRKRQSRSNNQY